MRVIVSLAIIFCIYYAIAASYLSREVETFLAHEPSLSATPSRVSGFPNHISIGLDATTLENRSGMLRWRAGRVSLGASSLRPFDLSILFPDTQSLVVAGERHTLEGYRMMGTVQIGRGNRLQELALDTGSVQITPPLVISRLGAADLSLTPSDEGRHALELDLREIRLAPEIRSILDPSGTLPDQIAQLELRAIHSVALTPAPEGRVSHRVDIERLDLTWGALSMQTEGTLTRDPADGHLDGTLTLTLQDWRPFHQLLTDTGLLAPDTAMMAGMFLSSIANEGGHAVSLPLTLRQSIVSLGPFGLVQLPPI